jgi:uncharacterized protein YndB with AHSA1/START domain
MQADTQPGADAPVRASCRMVIAASPEKVWTLLTQIERWPQWNPDVSAARLDGALATGSVFAWQSRGLTVTSTLLEVQPMRRLSWTGRSFGTRAFHAWNLEPQPVGVAVSSCECMDGWVPRLLARPMRNALADILAAWLAALKAQAEQQV